MIMPSPEYQENGIINHKTLSHKVLYFGRELIPALVLMALLVTSVYPGNRTLLYGFTGPDLTVSRSRILTVKFKNLLEQDPEFTVTLYSDLPDSQSGIPDSCRNRNEAETILANSEFDAVVWGEIGSIQEIFLTSAYLTESDEGEYTYRSFQDEVSGDLTDVLKYSVYNVAMSMLEQPDRRISKEEKEHEVADSGKEASGREVSEEESATGLIKINAPSENIQLYLNDERIGSGNYSSRVPVGTHRIVAKTENEVKTEVVKVSEDKLTYVSFSLGNGRNRRAHFFMGFDASWMLGKGIEFGPSHIVGIEIKRQHLIALNYYWTTPPLNISDDVSASMFGGGFNYLYKVNIKEKALIRIGAVAGFWSEAVTEYHDENYDDYTHNNYYYFGGPKVRFELGNNKVFFNVLDATLLIGNGEMKALLNTGISFLL